METIPHRVLANILIQTLPPHLASKFSRTRDLSFERIVSDLSFQEFQALAEYLRESARTAPNQARQPGT
jgi:cytochrome c553